LPASDGRPAVLSPAANATRVLQGADFGAIGFLCTRSFVALIIQVGDIWLIGVRGTQFAYEWSINLRIRKVPTGTVLVHGGFQSEAFVLGWHIGRRCEFCVRWGC